MAANTALASVVSKAPETTRQDSGAGASSSRATSWGSKSKGKAQVLPPTGRLVTSTAPWPFIDTSRPFILPEYVSPTSQTRVKRQPVELAAALQEVKANAVERLQGTERDNLSGRRRSRAAFDETVEFVANLAVNPRIADQIVRGAVVLPHGTGKHVSICVFAKGAEADVAREEGADVIGDDELIQAIIESGGKAVTFDKLIATPEFMKPLAKAGKVLGPKGLMPNVKLGTLTDNVAAAIREMRRGRVDFRVDREGIMHAALGKVSFPADHLLLNIGTFVGALLAHRPKSLAGSGIKAYIESAYVKSSMTSSVPVTVSSCAAAWEVAKAAAGGEAPAQASTTQAEGAEGARPAAGQ